MIIEYTTKYNLDEKVIFKLSKEDEFSSGFIKGINIYITKNSGCDCEYDIDMGTHVEYEVPEYKIKSKEN